MAKVNAGHIVRPKPTPSRSGRQFVYNGRRLPAFVARPYVWPAGYVYRRVYVGYYVPPVFWSTNYFITDYADYDVGPPPPDFGWLRYGSDLVLMNLDSGYVQQTVPGVFDDGGASGRYGPANNAPAPANYADAPPGFSSTPVESGPQPDIIRSTLPAYPTEPAPEAPPSFRYIGQPLFNGDPDQLPGDPPPPGGAD